MKIKTLTSVVLACAALFACVFGLSACGAINSGKLFTLKEVYENGEITRQDILSIAYYSNKGVSDKNKEQYPEDFVPTPKVPAEVDDDLISSIEKAHKYKVYKNTRGKSLFPVLYGDITVTVKDYYGTYGEYTVVSVNTEIKHVGYGTVILPLIMDGIIVAELNGGQEFLAYKNK